MQSGLLHHFGSRDDALFEALIREIFDDVRRIVYQRIDLTENRPSKLIRAYVRAMCDEIDWVDSEQSHNALNGLGCLGCGSVKFFYCSHRK